SVQPIVPRVGYCRFLLRSVRGQVPRHAWRSLPPIPGRWHVVSATFASLFIHIILSCPVCPPICFFAVPATQGFTYIIIGSDLDILYTRTTRWLELIQITTAKLSQNTKLLTMLCQIIKDRKFVSIYLENQIFLLFIPDFFELINLDLSVRKLCYYFEVPAHRLDETAQLAYIHIRASLQFRNSALLDMQHIGQLHLA